jgi:diguanylate cyclase (GGDEF)-like protein
VLTESAVIFTALVVGLLTTGVLLLLPSTWHGDGRSVRYWVIGNLALSLDRLNRLVPELGLVLPQDTYLLLLDQLSASLVVFGAGMHATAMRLMVLPERRLLDWRWPASFALGYGALALLLGEPQQRLVALLCCTSVCSGLKLAICWPQRDRLRGALVMSGAMGVLLLMQCGSIWELTHATSPTAAAPLPGALLALELVLSVVVNLAFLLILIELLHQRVERLSVTDPLTGAFNRRGFLQAANLQLLHAARLGGGHRPASVLLLDLDHFKRVNDDFGHPMGDAVLRGTVERVSASLRQTDMMCRWGGEEFAVLLPGSPLMQAGEVAERVRLTLAAAPLAEGAPIVTVSIGAAALDELLAVDQLCALIGEADRHLYLAKRRRNCVVLSDAGAAADGVNPPPPSRSQA